MTDQPGPTRYEVALDLGTVIMALADRLLILRDRGLEIPSELAALSPVERAVITARLRAWATLIEQQQ